jgi:hypothetical protein
MEDTIEWSPIIEGLVIILAHKPSYVNSETIQINLKPHFLGFLQTIIAAKPPYKTYKNIGVFGSNHITI